MNKGDSIMEYVKPADYEYIKNKYHDTTKPFNPFQRFIRHDEIFATETGLDGNEIMKKILEQDEKHTNLPHPIRKANAFAFVLNNTRIACDARDKFPAINAIDRPLNATIVNKWKNEVFHEIIPEVGKEMSYLESNGIVTIWPDFDHSLPVWERIFSLGFAGLLHESEQARKSRNLTPNEDAFFEGIKITYEAIISFIGRLANLAKSTNGSSRLAVALENIQYNPPATFYEALLVNYLYFMLSEHIEGLQVRTIGNFDRLFYSFYKTDLQNGVTESEIREDLAYFLLQFTAIGNYWCQPVFLGGCKKDESTEINELSYLFLDVYDKMGLYNPKIQIKVADSSPKSFLLKALDMIRRGKNSIVFVSDKTIRTALMKRGVSADEARLCNVKGCYEYSPPENMGLGMNYVNLLKPLEYALHEGHDGVKNFCGLKKP